VLKGEHKTRRIASGFVDFLKRYHKAGDEFLSHIAQVEVMKPGFNFEC
jgi:hypothetical protein